MVITCGGSKLEATLIQANQQGLTIKKSIVSEQCGGINYDKVLFELYKNRIMNNSSSNMTDEER